MKSWYISGDAILQWFVPLQKNEIKKIMKMHFWVHLDVEIKNPWWQHVFFLFLSIQLYKWKTLTQSKLTYIKYTFPKQFYKKN